MLDCTTFPLESIFWMACAFLFLSMCHHLVHKVADLKSDLDSANRLLQHATETVADMGFQLFNVVDTKGQHKPGYVYVVKSDSGHYKIGRTSDPQSRAHTFGVKLPVEIEFLVLIKASDMNNLETALHHQYEHKRHNGEWFSLSDTDLIWLRNFPGNIIKEDK